MSICDELVVIALKKSFCFSVGVLGSPPATQSKPM